MKQRIVLLGPPASGKGTQSEMISDAFGIPHVSTGVLLRSECARGTVLGREADSWTSRGLLVPDELAIRIITGWIAEHGTRFLFDGFPRSVRQAECLDAALDTLAAPLDLVVLLDLDETEIRSRIASRLSCLHCGTTFSSVLDGLSPDDKCRRCGHRLVRRNDDHTASLEQRLRVYRETTFPVIGYYQRTRPSLLHRVDARRECRDVFTDIARMLEG